jgi:hypothetical protein
MDDLRAYARQHVICLQTLLEDGRYCMSCWFKVSGASIEAAKYSSATCCCCLQYRCLLQLTSSTQGSSREHIYSMQDVPKTQAHAPFVNHWAACQMCTESIPMMVEDGGADNEWCANMHYDMARLWGL